MLSFCLLFYLFLIFDDKYSCIRLYFEVNRFTNIYTYCMIMRWMRWLPETVMRLLRDLRFLLKGKILVLDLSLAILCRGCGTGGTSCLLWLAATRMLSPVANVLWSSVCNHCAATSCADSCSWSGCEGGTSPRTIIWDSPLTLSKREIRYNNIKCMYISLFFKINSWDVYIYIYIYKYIYISFNFEEHNMIFVKYKTINKTIFLKNGQKHIKGFFQVLKCFLLFFICDDFSSSLDKDCIILKCFLVE